MYVPSTVQIDLLIHPHIYPQKGRLIVVYRYKYSFYQTETSSHVTHHKHKSYSRHFYTQWPLNAKLTLHKGCCWFSYRDNKNGSTFTYFDAYTYSTSSMGSWIRAWDFLTHGHDVRLVGGSNPGRGCIVVGVFHSTRKLARLSPPNIYLCIYHIDILLFHEIDHV